jgi:hypothetical protein
VPETRIPAGKLIPMLASSTRAACDHPAEGPGELPAASGVPLLGRIRARMHEAVMAATCDCRGRGLC